MEPVAVKVEYSTFPNASPTGEEPEGIEEFCRELQESYVALVRGTSGVCSGGLYDFVITITSNITLRDVVNLMLGGVAYDVIKSGARSFVLRPLLTAFAKLRSANTKWDLEIDELRLSLQETDIVIKQIGTHPLSVDLKMILETIAKNFEFMKGRGKEVPYVIHIPVFEDSNPHFCRFRSLLDVDETIQGVTQHAYAQYWGVRYNLSGQIRVFDVERRLIIEEEYMTQSEYWQAWQREWDKEQLKKS